VKESALMIKGKKRSARKNITSEKPGSLGVSNQPAQPQRSTTNEGRSKKETYGNSDTRNAGNPARDLGTVVRPLGNGGGCPPVGGKKAGGHRGHLRK